MISVMGATRRGRSFLGVIGYRAAAVIDWLCGIGVPRLARECVVGNVASATVARTPGSTYTGEAPTALGFRAGSNPASWHGTLASRDDRAAKAGWPL